MTSKKRLPHAIAGVPLSVFIVLVLICARPVAAEIYRPIGRIPGATAVGPIQANFTSASVSRTQTNGDAYIALLMAARRSHTGNIDVVNITWSRVRRGQYTANGTIVSVPGGGAARAAAPAPAAPAPRRPAATGVEGALEMAAQEVSENFTDRARIAIVHVSAEDRGVTEFIAGELEHLLRRQGFVIVDRSELDRVRAEQQLGLGFEVDDNTAARIGHFAGASVVITGGVDGFGDLRRLRLRALDTATAQVIGTASERM